MLHVELDHILTQDDALERIREIIDHVEQQGEIYVVTKEGRPAVAIVSVDQLEHGLDTPAVARQAVAEAPDMPEPEPQPEPGLPEPPPLPEPPLMPQPLPMPATEMPPAMPEPPSLPDPAPLPAPPSLPQTPAMPVAAYPADGSPMSEELVDSPATPTFKPFTLADAPQDQVVEAPVLDGALQQDLPPLSGTDTLGAPTTPNAMPATKPAGAFSVPALPDMPE